MPVTRPRRALIPRKTPRQARAHDTVAAILRAAAQVFSQVGYAAGTTNRIAERAGVSIGSLYEYFPNKDALLVALVEAHVREGEAVLLATAASAPVRSGDLRAAVRAFVEAMVALHAQDVALHRVLFEEAPLPRSVRRLLVEVEARITTHLTSVLANDPSVTVPDPARAAAMTVQVVEALTHRFVLSDGDDPEAFTDETVRLVLRYLTASDGSDAVSGRRARARWS